MYIEENHFMQIFFIFYVGLVQNSIVCGSFRDSFCGLHFYQTHIDCNEKRKYLTWIILTSISWCQPYRNLKYHS